MTKPVTKSSQAGVRLDSGAAERSTGALNRVPAIQEVVRLLNSMFHEVDVFSRRSLRKYCITGPQIWVLRTVDSQENITMGALAQRLYLHPSTVSGIVDRLEAHGYVTRTRQAEDARSYTLALTKMAKCVLQTAPEPPRSKVAKGLERLSDQELEEVLRSIRALGSIMQIPGNEVGPP
jgi:MarR family transcriptional regulator, organic hydroperoxide resistance regulator